MRTLFTSALIWIGSIAVASTRDLYGSDLNENRSKIDPLPFACSLKFIAVYIVTLNLTFYDFAEDSKWSKSFPRHCSRVQLTIILKPRVTKS